MVSLTEEGWQVLVAAAPGHVETVRCLVFDGLSPDEVNQLQKIAGHIVSQIDGANLSSVRR